MRLLRKLLALVLACIMGMAICMPAMATEPFSDVPSWCEKEVYFVTEKKLMEGIGGGKFDPNGTLTQGQLATILARLDGIDTKNSTPWYRIGINWALEEGVCDTAAPSTVLTRADVVDMLWRYKGAPKTAADLSAFVDSEDASDAATWAVYKGILTGDDKNALNLTQHVRRSEIAVMLTRLLETQQGNTQSGTDNRYFQSLNADKLNICDTGIYDIHLQAKYGWQFDVSDNTDVTHWIVDAQGKVLFPGQSGIAFAFNGEDHKLDIRIDASKITGFNSNGSGELYVSPNNSGIPLVVDQSTEIHGQFHDGDVSEFVGIYTIPEVRVIGGMEAESYKGFRFKDNDVTIALVLDGIDDTLIDSGASIVELLAGDGYYLNDYSFQGDTLTGSWTNGKLTYMLDPEQFSGTFSPLGGDGNGNYYANIGVKGITYNGLPLAQGTFRIHVYAYGRTFSGAGSLIYDTQPVWTSVTAGYDLPVLCDAYPDLLNITWPTTFDASALTTDDFTLTLKGDYGDELVLKAGKDFVVSSNVSSSSIVVNYIYWAYIPVYKIMTVDIATDHLTWNSQMYRVSDKISHDYDIASVYAYSIMNGGMTGTQFWTYYGVDGFESWEQAFHIPHYTLSYTDETTGTVRYYTEDTEGVGSFTDLADNAKQFTAESSLYKVENNVASFARVNANTTEALGVSMTQQVTVGGKDYVCDKNYDNADGMPLANPHDCIGITALPGYVLGDGWSVHNRWPWQDFTGNGFLGGSM